MVHSDWGTWLPQAVMEDTPEGVSIWYLGCNGFIIKGADDTTIFIDPYLGTGDPPRTIRMIPVPFDPEDVIEADAVLATHDHTDHIHGPSQGPILAGTGASLYAPLASIEVVNAESWTSRWEIANDQINTVEIGDELQVGEFTIHVLPAYDPDAKEPVSYVIEHPAGTIFHGGDSKPSDKFEAIGTEYTIDLAIVAFGTVGNLYDREYENRSRTAWYSNENELVEIANALQTDRLLPSHWDMWKGTTADPTVLHHHISSWPYPHSLEIVEIGDRVEL